MAKRKKYPKLPNGYGSIKKLSGNRRNPYGVYPPAVELIAPGQYAPVKAICYTDSWMKGFAILTAYHAGNYYPGYERTLNKFKDCSISSILADYTQAFRPSKLQKIKPTFSEVYESFYKFKYEDSGKEYSDQSKRSTRAAFKNCSFIHDTVFEELRYDDLQKVIDYCPLAYSSLELILSLFHQMYAYAEIYELVDKDHSKHVYIKKEDDDKHGVPFNNEELQIFWNNKDNEIVELILILCYSGFRITEIKTAKVNFEGKFFCGGIKTDAGKNRNVPIHSGIFELVEKRLLRDKCMLKTSTNFFRNNMYHVLDKLGIRKHTPHDCRHTFSALCERYKVAENDRKRMLGHKLNDVTNDIYGHRTIEDLRAEIEKIEICH